jgi:hypothetical protein
LKEEDYVIIARREYLRKKLANRKNNNSIIRPEVYLDESYIKVNHSVEKTWYFTDDGPWVNKPSGKGPRLIIVNAITKEGWVPNAKLVFKLNNPQGIIMVKWIMGIFQSGSRNNFYQISRHTH